MGTNVYISSGYSLDIVRTMSYSDDLLNAIKIFDPDEQIFFIIFGNKTSVFKNPEDIFPIKNVPFKHSMWYDVGMDTYVVCDPNQVLIPFTTFLDMMEYLECL